MGSAPQLYDKTRRLPLWVSVGHGKEAHTFKIPFEAWWLGAPRRPAATPSYLAAPRPPLCTPSLAPGPCRTCGRRARKGSRARVRCRRERGMPGAGLPWPQGARYQGGGAGWTGIEAGGWRSRQRQSAMRADLAAGLHGHPAGRRPLPLPRRPVRPYSPDGASIRRVQARRLAGAQAPAAPSR